MNIDSPRFGSLEIEPSRILEFPEGLAGFEDCKRYTLFHPDAEKPLYFILQSLDDPAVAFHIADPAQLGFSFDVDLTDEEIELLQLKNPADAAVVVILSKDELATGGAANDGSKLKANLKAPLVLNLESRRGLQHVFGRLNYNVIK